MPFCIALALTPFCFAVCWPVAVLPAASDPKTVAPVAEAVGSAAAAGLNTSVFAESIAAAFAKGGVSVQAMSAALTKAATTGGCNGTTRALSGAAGCQTRACTEMCFCNTLCI
jgi:hypothetical protein